MGRTVSKSGQISKSQSLIFCALERQQDVYNTMMALEAFTSDGVLTGEAYENAKGYIQSIYSPINKSICIVLEDEISASKSVIDCCNTYLADIDAIDEDTLLSEIARLQRECNELQDDWWDFLPLVREINLIRISYCFSQIEKLNGYLQKLYAFENATQELHNAADIQLKIISQKINLIFSPDVFFAGKIHYSNVDMKWSSEYLTRWKAFVLSDSAEVQIVLQIATEQNISYEHARIIYYSQKWEIEEVTWSTWDIVTWKTSGGREFLFEKKKEFVRNYSDVISDAAEKYDLPEFLLAGIVFTEFGGDPLWIDNIAYDVRSFNWSGPDWGDENLTLTKNPDLTSFGNTSIQVRRALEMLGYSSCIDSQKDAVISSLENPIEDIYMAAKHLDVLRNVDFSGIPADELTNEDIQIIASRYNLGPDVDKEDAEQWSYGESIFGNQDEILEALSK